MTLASQKKSPRSPADFVAVLARAAGWLGDNRQLHRALPLGKTTFGPQDFVGALENLRLSPIAQQTRARSVKPDDLPCLVIPPSGKIILLTDIKNNTLTGTECYNGSPTTLKRDGTKLSLLRGEPLQPNATPLEAKSVFDILRSLIPAVRPLMAMSFMINMLSLCGPILVMAIYDSVIPTGNTTLVLSFASIVTVVLITDFAIRTFRATTLSQIGAAVERRLSLALFVKLTSLPLAQMTRSTTHQQMNRIKQFESMREVFSGSLLVTLIDLPFLFLFLAVISYVAPYVGLLLGGVALLLLVATLLTLPRQNLLSSEAAEASAAHTTLLHELSQHKTALSRFGLLNAYDQRNEKLGKAAADAGRALKSYQSLIQNVAQTVSAGTTVSAIALASLLAMQSSISFGALIVIATLSGRVLGPVQTLCSSALRIKGLFGTFRQVESVLAMEPELSDTPSPVRAKTFEGAISAKNLFVRFDAANDPSLAGVTLDIQPRSLVVLTGKSGAGKSTLLKAMTKLVIPGSGSISLDGINLKQILVDDLRNAVSLDVQDPNFFDMTLLENLTLGNPTVDRETLTALFEALGAKRDLRRFFRGLDTDMSQVAAVNLTANVRGTISLVRCLAKQSSVYLLDDPFVGMTPARTASIWRHLRNIAEHATVIVVSQNLDHLRQADQIISLDAGRVVLNDSGVEAAQKAYAMLNFNAATAQRELS